MAKMRHIREMIMPTWLMMYRENSICQEGDTPLREGLTSLQAEKRIIQTPDWGRKDSETFSPFDTQSELDIVQHHPLESISTHSHSCSVPHFMLY